IRKLLPWLLIAAVIAFAVYRLKFSPTPVTAHIVAIGEVRSEVMGTGTLNTHYKAAASPKVFQGRLVQVLVDQNDFVTNGQLLAKLDDSEQRRQVETAQATLNAARATVRRVGDDEARSEAVLKLARIEFDRVASLFTNRIASASEYDTAVEQLRVGEAGLAVAQSAIVEAEHQQIAADKQLGYQQELLADTLIPAPFNGLVVKRNHDPGDVVIPGGSIVDVVDTNEVWVSAWVDETAMAPLRLNQPARVVFRSEPGRVFSGWVARLGRQTDPETREFVVDVRVRELPANWTVGQRAEVYIETACAANTLVLPAKFLLWREGQPGVLVNDRGRASWRTVKLGLRGGEVMGVTSGLAAGVQVVAPRAGANALALEGKRVRLPPAGSGRAPTATP
ncbi:MAG: efflux RND transporter periplasmic adaptor subunit, partial [Limisphaerales bacterium]